MRRAGIQGALIGLLLALPAGAQDVPDATRPPVAPLSDIARPPPRPAEPAAEAPQAAAGAGSPLASPEPATEDPAPSTVDAGDAGAPAAPPAWQTLAEGEIAYRSCLIGLHLLGVGFAEAAPVHDEKDRDCGIARPLRVAEIQPGVTLAGAPLMRCQTAWRLALWLRTEAQPAVNHLPGAPKITEIQPGSTYQCRARVGGAGEKLSEHALGNAFDVAAFRLSDGALLKIAPRDDSGGMEEAVQKALRHGACLYFTTVLGPGSNAAHDDHLHFDIAARRGGWRICE